MTTDETRLRTKLVGLAATPAPDDLVDKMLARDEFTVGSPRRPRVRLGGGRVLLVSAAVVAIVLGTTAIVLSNSGSHAPPVSPPVESATTESSGTGSTGTASTATAATTAAVTGAGQAVITSDFGPSPTSSRSSSAHTSGQPASEILVARGPFPALDVQQSHPCAGLPPVPRADLGLLAKGAVISKVAVCRTTSSYGAGHGLTTATISAGVDPISFKALTAQLTAGDRPAGPNTTCDRTRLELDFVVYLVDGHVLRPGAPTVGCTVPTTLTAILDAAVGGERSTSVLPDRLAVRGCRPGGEVSEPFSNATLGGDTFELPHSGKLSVCRYAYTSQTGYIRLDQIGSTSAELMTGDPVVASKECARSDVRAPSQSGFVAFVTPPQEPVTTNTLARSQTVLYVEIGGCHRMLSGDGMVMDWAPQRILDLIATTTMTQVPVVGG